MRSISAPIRAEHVEVGPEDLHRDLRGHAAEHVGEPVADRLADIRESAGDVPSFLRISAKTSCARALPPSCETRRRIRSTDTGIDVVVALGAAGAAADAFHLGNAEQQPHADVADLVALLRAKCPGALANEMVALPSLKAGRNSLPIIG